MAILDGFNFGVGVVLSVFCLIGLFIIGFFIGQIIKGFIDGVVSGFKTARLVNKSHKM